MHSVYGTTIISCTVCCVPVDRLLSYIEYHVSTQLSSCFYSFLLLSTSLPLSLHPQPSSPPSCLLPSLSPLGSNLPLFPLLSLSSPSLSSPLTLLPPSLLPCPLSLPLPPLPPRPLSLPLLPPPLPPRLLYPPIFPPPFPYLSPLLTISEQGSQAFEQFLTLLGNKVKMRGFAKYRAQLDNKSEYYHRVEEVTIPLSMKVRCSPGYAVPVAVGWWQTGWACTGWWVGSPEDGGGLGGCVLVGGWVAQRMVADWVGVYRMVGGWPRGWWRTGWCLQDGGWVAQRMVADVVGVHRMVCGWPGGWWQTGWMVADWVCGWLHGRMVADWVGGSEDGDQPAAWEDGGRLGWWLAAWEDDGRLGGRLGGRQGVWPEDGGRQRTRFIPSLFSLLLP